MKLKRIIFAIGLIFMGVFLFACEEQPVELDTPKNLSIIDEMLSWTQVENTTGYSIYISENNIVTETTTSYSLSSLLPGNYELKVKALGDGVDYADSEWSTALPYEAQLNQNEYLVIFNSNKPLTADKNITGIMANQVLEFDNEQKINNNNFALEGWTFTGWNTEANGTGISYEDEAYVVNLTEEESITLYAQWTENQIIKTYEIIFNSNKPASALGTVTGTMANQVVLYDEEQRININTYQLEDWTFTGWNTVANGSGTSIGNHASIINLTEEETITLYAQWVENQVAQIYEVIFDSNKPAQAIGEVTGIMANQIITFDDPQDLTKNTFRLEGWTFVGWNTKANGTGQTIQDQEIVYNLAEDSITLYAQWTENQIIQTYEVVFNSNKPASASGSVTGVMANQVIFYDEYQDLTRNSFQLTGWTFNGWNTKANGTGLAIFDQEIVYNLAEESIVLYAQWTEIPKVEKTVKFYGPNTTVIRQVNVLEGNVVQRPTDLETQANYTFINWYTSSSFFTTYNFNTAVNSDLNIYGKWQPNGQGHYAYVGTYYANIDFINFTSTERSELLTLLEKQPARSYSSSTWSPCEYSAVDPNNSKNVILIYNSASVAGSSHNDAWNKEHVWPQSKMPTSIAGDQHNLFPCNPSINSNRGSLSFVDSSGAHGKVGSSYYPGDEWRGEVARTLMYMAYRYNLNLGTLIDPATALKWTNADPVTKWEMDRNDILFTKDYQKNRNPFVDHPELAQIMYGTSATSLQLSDNNDSFVIDLVISILNYDYIPMENKSNIVQI